MLLTTVCSGHSGFACVTSSLDLAVTAAEKILASSTCKDTKACFKRRQTWEVVQVLLDKGVEEGKILFLSLIAAPEGVHKICGQYPRLKVVTTEIDEGIASDFQVIPGNAVVWRLLCAVMCVFPLSLAALHCLTRGLKTQVCCFAGVGEFGDRYFCD